LPTDNFTIARSLRAHDRLKGNTQRLRLSNLMPLDWAFSVQAEQMDTLDSKDIRVLFVDDHQVLRKGLIGLIKTAASSDLLRAIYGAA